MSDNLPTLSVCIRELPSMRVACESCPAGGDQAAMAPCIRAAFQHVQAFLRSLDHDPYTLLTIGALRLAEGQPSTYDCCVQVPSGLLADPPDGITFAELPGGRYAVLTIVKDPAVIGPTIGRFYGEHVPQHQLSLDHTRPTYEIYYEKTMEFCVPVL